MERYQWLTVLKGMIVGGTMVVPGVSGGSMAMILGVYDRLVTAVSSFTKNTRRNFLFLLLFSIGGGAGILLFSRPMLWLLEAYPKPMLYFFLGAVAGGVPLIFQEAEIKRITWKVPVYLLAGMFLVICISRIPGGIFPTDMNTGLLGYLYLMLAGFLAAAALVLPGISVSYLFLILGLYDEIMRAVSVMYLPFLMPLASGLLLGVVFVTKFLEYAMTKHSQATYLIILGFVAGSIAGVFPGVPTLREIPVCAVTLGLGYGAIALLSAQNGERG